MASRIIIEKRLAFREAALEMLYDDVYKVTKVDMKDFGSQDMRHFEVGGA